MKHKDLFKTYVWLVETVYRHGPISLEGIGKLWAKSSLCNGNKMARSSFNRFREEIEDVFGVRIMCKRTDTWCYCIEELQNITANNVQNWMANNILLNNVIAENRVVSNRILLESIPSEGANLQTVIEAMRMSKMLAIDYRKYKSEAPTQYEVEPYCVKLYHRRWYVLVRRTDIKEFRVLALDRIVGLDILKKKFKVKDSFDAAGFFSECFGVLCTRDIPVQKIVLRAHGAERFYMRDLPVHPSQRLVAEAEDYADYEVELRPTGDFMGYLMSRAQWIEVISPQNVVDEMKKIIAATQARYK